LIRILSLS